MAIHLDYPPGATPLDADERASLIPGHITTQGELNEWEQLNIVQGENWARKQRKEILNEASLICPTLRSVSRFMLFLSLDLQPCFLRPG